LYLDCFVGFAFSKCTHRVLNAYVCMSVRVCVCVWRCRDILWHTFASCPTPGHRLWRVLENGEKSYN